MIDYLNALETVFFNGKHIKNDRTGVGTYSYSRGIQLSFDLQEGFPLVTTKRVFWKSVVAELIWFLRGSTSLKELQDMNCHIWDEWQKDDEDDLGPIYGYQWRSWMHSPYGPKIAEDGWLPEDSPETDQIANVIDSIQNNPFSRRHIVTAWNPLNIKDSALPPCHILFQFFVEPDKQGNPKYLNCHLYQRSADFFIGVPFNIASYSLLTTLIAKQVGLKPGHFVHSFGDAHIYSNHIEQVYMQLRRQPKQKPTLALKETPDLKTMKWKESNAPISLGHFYLTPSLKDNKSYCMNPKNPLKLKCNLLNYQPDSYIKAPVAV